MKTKVNIFATEWCNLVFEGKNKEYGAYELRQRSSKRHAITILLSVSVFTLGVSAPVLLKSVSPSTALIHDDGTILSNIPTEEPKKIDIPETPPPQIRRTIRFVVPEVSNTEEQEAPPVIDIIKDDQGTIGDKDQDGSIDPALPVAPKEATQETEEPAKFVEQMPKFPGGEDAWAEFLKNNLRYPSIAAEMGISGRVILQFVVEKDGHIDRITVLRSLGGGCDEEAIRVVKMMPNWNPGRQNGKAVPVYFTFPVVFTLHE
jgi:protein TonB